IAPSTPPPPSRDELAALTMASVVSLVMSAGPASSSVFPLAKVSRAAKSDIAAPKGTVGEVRLSAPLKRCPDTKHRGYELRAKSQKLDLRPIFSPSALRPRATSCLPETPTTRRRRLKYG